MLVGSTIELPKVGTTVLHQIVYTTDKPKRLELGDHLESLPYHLLFYMISRFFFIDDGHSKVEYYYPNKKNNYLCEQALKHLPERFVRVTDKDDTYEHVLFPGCIWTTDNIHEPWMYSYVRKIYRHIWDNVPQQKGKRTYISRNPRRIPRRNIVNEDELIPILKRHGFSCYELETLTFEDTIRLFKSSDFIMGPHGSGLAWLIYCDPGTFVCEIMKNVPEKDHYLNMSKDCGFQYYRFHGVESDGEDVSYDGNMRVHVPSFEDCLQRLVELREHT